MRSLVAFLISLLMASSAPAELLQVPPMAAKESGSVVTSTKGDGMRWKVEWTTEQTILEGLKVVRMTEIGQGRYSPFEQQVCWIMEGLWRCEGSFSPMRFEKIVSDTKGRQLLKERKTFDFASGRVRFEREDYARGTSTLKEIAVPPDTLAMEGIAMALRSLPFDTARPFRASVLTNEPKLYPVTLKTIGRERVNTPAGEFDCYKVELAPQLGFLDLFRIFTPKIYFWFTSAYPHFWVRYQGLESGPGTPHVVIELTGFEQGK